MDNSLYRLLRYGNVICLQFHNGNKKSYTMRMGMVYNIEDFRLHEAEEQLNIDFNDKSLLQIDMHIYFKDKEHKTLTVWKKSEGSFNWATIFTNMKSVRKEIGFIKTDFFKHKTDIVPLKILCAKTYRDHFGLEACYSIARMMDYETQQSVFRKQVWWV